MVRYKAGIPLSLLGVERIPPEDSFVFLKGRNLPLDKAEDLKEELLQRKLAREPRTNHFFERLVQRHLNPNKGFKKILGEGRIFQVNFDRLDGRLRYIGLRIANEKTPLADDVFLYQLEETRRAGLTVVLVTGWKCPIRREISSDRQKNFSNISELTWDEVMQIRQSH